MSFKVDDIVWTKSKQGWFQVVEVDEIQKHATLKLLSNSSDETLYKGGFLKKVGFESMTKITKQEAFAYINRKRADLNSLEDTMIFAFSK